MITNEPDRSQAAPETLSETVNDFKILEKEIPEERAASPPNVPIEAVDTKAIDSMSSDSKYIVDWDKPVDKDPENPLNWPDWRKWSIIGLLSFLSFLTPLASSMLAPGVPLVLKEFQTNNDQLATFVVSAFVLGFAVGPLVVAPMSELYGRTKIYHISNCLFVIFTIACAVSNSMGMLIAFRFLAGCAGVTVVTCGSGTIVDLMPPEKRGTAMALWSVGPLLGPVVGPVCAGFLVAAKGWRWVFWVIAIAAGVATVGSFFILRETYGPELLERRAKHLRKETGDPRYHSSLKKQGTASELFFLAIVRPARMLVLAPLVTTICIYIAAIYGISYLLFTTFTFVYSESAGLSFIASGVGTLAGLVYSGTQSDRIIRNKMAKGEPIQPEDRLSLIIVGPAVLCLPAGLIIYGWTAEKQVFWIGPMIGSAIMSMGMMGVFMGAQTYLIDSFPKHAASATAANGVLRSLLGAVLPLFGLQLYDALGLGWGNTLLGLILLVLAPVPVVISKFGHKIRSNPKFMRDF
ncbi:hypothetical protein TruAng_007197 [Truncatella angustata]|nr:hypothetical protein TruAng_007197 [Truncatella angustata]